MVCSSLFAYNRHEVFRDDKNGNFRRQDTSRGGNFRWQDTRGGNFRWQEIHQEVAISTARNKVAAF